MEINNKIAIVTGGASGMGAETAQYLSSKGAKVAIIDMNLEKATKIAAQIDGLAFSVNVTDSKEIELALQGIKQTWGLPNICINCAGIAPAERVVGRHGPMPLENFEKVIAVNLVGTFNVIRMVAALMSQEEPTNADHERGVIINTASIAAYEGQIGQSAYSASKGGICAMTLPIARELAQFGIRVVTVAPGLIQTPLFEGFSQDIQERLASNIPFPKRLGYPREFAKLVAHIIENSYLNGEIIRLDAGLRMQSS